MKRSVRNLIAYIIVMVFMAQFLVFAPVTAADVKLSGTAFGTGPAYTAGHEYDKGTDGSTTTYVDEANASGGYTGWHAGAIAGGVEVVLIAKDTHGQRRQNKEVF